ncbi:hypothetical protein TorRG33x02_293540 [Trema orientale]|uniref:Uncharacterized protein n=1 Tax=Trema orientale TaxID=63057 RepID=A0A2P5C8X0_TREOI|nr:hypothetical protein TorRG33x02_293540 [Trema orientale]
MSTSTSGGSVSRGFDDGLGSTGTGRMRFSGYRDDEVQPVQGWVDSTDSDWHGFDGFQRAWGGND